MSALKISYSLTRRTSQSRAADTYQDILRQRHQLVATQDVADIVVVHHPPINYQTVFALHPALRNRYVISCCAPHGSHLSKHWQTHLSLVQEVWTCSRYCFDVLSQHHPNVVLIPYVAERDFRCSPEALSLVQRMIGYDPKNYYFLSIGPLRSPRKNLQALIETFRRAKEQMPRARLIVKAGAFDAPGATPDENITILPMMLPFECISALYRVANAFVSPHRVEVWGLGMSDAMLAGIPVIATGHSGNLEYMTEANSVLLPWQEQKAPSQVLDDEWEAGMVWADPDAAALENALVDLYHNHAVAATQERVARAAEDIRRYGRESVAELIWNRISMIANGPTARVA